MVAEKMDVGVAVQVLRQRLQGGLLRAGAGEMQMCVGKEIAENVERPDRVAEAGFTLHFADADDVEGFAAVLPGIGRRAG